MATARSGAASSAGTGQPELRLYFGKITKPSVARPIPKAVDESIGNALPHTKKIYRWITTGSKRKYQDDEDETQNKEQEPVAVLPQAKKPKLKQAKSRLLVSPRASIDKDASPISSKSSGSGTQACEATTVPPAVKQLSAFEDLPANIKNVIQLHQSFLKALSIHYAHNGMSVPAELSTLMKTMTCLYKKRTVVQVDIQRMLAIYEVVGDTKRLLERGENLAHCIGPFKLISSGSGNIRICVEYVGVQDDLASVNNQEGGLPRTPFSEASLQNLYKTHVTSLCLALGDGPGKHHLAFLYAPLDCFPLLSCEVGTQTAAHREKISSLRNEIVSISASAQKRQANPSTLAGDHDRAEENESTEVLVKRRAQSLFDRIAAKQVLSSSSTIPTPSSILRRHAIGRIEGLVEILRMKQQQKTTFSMISEDLTSGTKRKVSFSLRQLQSDVRDSANIPISDEEVRACLKMLAEELPGGWIKIVDSGSGEMRTQFVVIEGEGMRGQAARKFLEDKDMS